MNWHKTNANIGNPFYQGEVHAPYETIRRLFGAPSKGDGYKTDAEWKVMFEDGTIATIYNWKNGRNYNGKSGLPKTRITEWHVGGENKSAVMLVKQAIAGE